MKKPRLTKKTYFDDKKSYWSASQYKQFCDCESKAMAEIRGEYERPASNALTIGSYIDTALTEPKMMEQFIKSHPEMFKKDGTLKAEFVKCDEMIDRAKRDRVFMEYLKGQKQKIITFDLDGIPFKAKLDVYRKGERIVDLKTVKDMEYMYRAGEGRMSPIEYWRWTDQLALYQYGIEQTTGDKLPCYLAIITKETVPALYLVELDQEILDASLNFVRSVMPRFDAIKSGIIEPEHCDNCDWCKATKIITEPVKFSEMIDL